jgi:hypothetical protein
MHDIPLTIPQHADPIARGLLLCLLAALIGLAVSPPTSTATVTASAPIVIGATPSFGYLSHGARLATPTPPLRELPTAPPAQDAAKEAAAPTAPVPPSPTPEASASVARAAPSDSASPVALGPQLPEGPQQLHQEPDATYITVGDSPFRYYLDADGQVSELRLPGADTAASGADIAALARATTLPTAAPPPVPTAPRGYLPRTGYRPKKP